MKKIPTIFLQIVITLIAFGALAFLILEPQYEGRNINATLFEIYFNDLFLAYAYAASIPFFIALYQAFKVLNNIRKNNIFSTSSIEALRTLRYCILTTAGLIFAAVLYLFIVRPSDDIAGGVAMGLFTTLVSVTIAAAASVFESILQK